MADPLAITNTAYNLVRMTRKIDVHGREPVRRTIRPDHWSLQEAKARLSELVRRVRSDGPQHVTVHGRAEIVVIAAEEFRRLTGERTGRSLIAAMQASPHRDVEIEPRRIPMPVRDVEL